MYQMSSQFPMPVPNMPNMPSDHLPIPMMPSMPIPRMPSARMPIPSVQSQIPSANRLPNLQ